jgi:hypothetical protein
MVQFHGNLLIGGMSLTDLQGLIDAENACVPGWRGEFVVNVNRRSCLEIGRPYLLQLSDGRTGQVVVSEIAEKPLEQVAVVRISGTSPLR